MIADRVLFENFDQPAVIGLISENQDDFPLNFKRWEPEMEFLDEESG